LYKINTSASVHWNWHTGIRRDQDEHQIPWYTKTIPATVTSDTSSFNQKDLKINEKEPSVVFFSKVMKNRKVELSIALFFKSGIRIISENQISSIPSLNVDHCLNISFHRTIRIPDDGAVYPLPPSLGAFPLLNVKDYEHKFWRDAAEKGGVFIPMYRK